MIRDVEIRKATTEDILAFYSAGVPRTCYGWIAYYKGEPACFAGITLERGSCMAFSEIKPGINAPKLTVWRTAKALLEEIKSLNLPITAACNRDMLDNQAFVERLGFKRAAPYRDMEIFKW